MKKQSHDINRRQLLKSFAIGSTATLSATLITPAKANSKHTIPLEKKPQGYQETEHILAYYASLK